MGKGKQRKKDQYKSNLLAFSTIVDDLKSSNLLFMDKHMQLMKQTPFWGLFDAFNWGVVEEQTYKKSDECILQLINCFDARAKVFRFRSTLVKLQPADVKSLFGLPDSGMKVDLNNKHTPSYNDIFVFRNFNPEASLTKTQLEVQLRQTLNGKRENDVEDSVRIIWLLLCCMILFATTNYGISWNLVLLFEDIESLGNINWSQAVVYFLLTSSIEKPHHRPTDVIGCTILLPLWFAKVTKCTPVPPLKSNLDQEFLRWDLKLIAEFVKGNDFDNVEISIAGINCGGSGNAGPPSYTSELLIGHLA